ncbi:MAG: hypothetical protein KatS3mg082_1977 [Nitrospiraceae bacterium]|nr:MAG: hypothetical protein KatS3mg082_1977 [Nitrospiraceae bacterium]
MSTSTMAALDPDARPARPPHVPSATPNARRHSGTGTLARARADARRAHPVGGLINAAASRTSLSSRARAGRGQPPPRDRRLLRRAPDAVPAPGRVPGLRRYPRLPCSGRASCWTASGKRGSQLALARDLQSGYVVRRCREPTTATTPCSWPWPAGGRAACWPASRTRSWPRRICRGTSRSTAAASRWRSARRLIGGRDDQEPVDFVLHRRRLRHVIPGQRWALPAPAPRRSRCRWPRSTASPPTGRASDLVKIDAEGAEAPGLGRDASKPSSASRVPPCSSSYTSSATRPQTASFLHQLVRSGYAPSLRELRRRRRAHRLGDHRRQPAGALDFVASELSSYGARLCGHPL